MGIGINGIGLCFTLLMAISSARAGEDRFCPGADDAVPTTRIGAWHAGSVTMGKPVLLRIAFDSPESSCVGMACYARGGVPGVEVQRKGSSVCVGVPERGKLATMFGWIPATRWQSSDSSPQPSARWVGVWQNETAKITVQSTNGGQLDIRGHAVRDLGLGTGEIFGDFETTGRPEHGIVTGVGDDSGCRVSTRLLGSYLVVADNGACGGIGVSFSGMYRLRHH